MPSPQNPMALPRWSGGKDFEQHRLRQRLQRSSAGALHQAEQDQERQSRRDPTQERRCGESHHREHQQPLAPEIIREPSRNRQNDGVGNQVRRQHPGDLVDRCRKIAGDVRKRHVDHRGIQHLHEGAKHHRDGYDPGVDVSVLGHCGRCCGQDAERTLSGYPAPRLLVGQPGFADKHAKNTQARQGRLFPAMPAICDVFQERTSSTFEANGVWPAVTVFSFGEAVRVVGVRSSCEGLHQNAIEMLGRNCLHRCIPLDIQPAGPLPKGHRASLWLLPFSPRRGMRESSAPSPGETACPDNARIPLTLRLLRPTLALL